VSDPMQTAPGGAPDATAPTPTNEQQDAPGLHAMIEAEIARPIHLDDTHEGCVPVRRLNAVLAAVSAAAPEPCPECGPGYRYGDDGCRHTPAAAPDEREALLAQAWEAAQARYPGESGLTDASRGAFIVGWSSCLDAALAARPAPVVNGEAVLTTEQRDDAVWALCDYDTDLADRGGQPSDEHWSTRLDDVNRVLAALGITVADAPAADDEGARA
jgi:hypothetical protein